MENLMKTRGSCRWGILGTANIARKNWKAIRNSGNSTLTAVASRSADRARQFIDDCQACAPGPPAPKACGSYDELLQRSDVDAVYVPLPTGIRKEWVIRAAEAGKHVLCEKPCGSNAGEVREMLDACRRNGVQFMDAVMFMHSDRMTRLREVLEDGSSIGRLKRIATQFTFRGDDEFFKQNIRTSGQLEPLGCLGDLGWYTIRFALWVMKYQLPERVVGNLLEEHRRPDGGQAVPTDFSGELFFPGGMSASFYCSFIAEIQQWAIVSGSKGYLEVPDFVLPWHGSELGFTVTNSFYDVRGCDFNMQSRTHRLAVPEYSNSFAPSQESNMIRHFADLVLAGRIDESWGEIALKTQQVLDACLLSAREQKRMDFCPS
jgi:predicted dehydrogenase